MLLEDAGISTALTITPGQIVSVTGDRSLPEAPLWGSGTFSVQERGSLVLNYVTIESDLTVLGGGGLTLQASAMSGAVTVTDGVLTVLSSSLSSDLSVSGGSTASLTGCTGQLTGLTVTDSAFSMDASLTITLGGSISLTNSGAVTLQDKTFEDGTSLTVGGGTQLSLSGCSLGSSTITMNSGGSLSLASMAVPANVLRAAEVQLSGAGSSIQLSAVTMPEAPAVGKLSGTMTVEADGSKTSDPPRTGRGRPRRLWLL